MQHKYAQSSHAATLNNPFAMQPPFSGKGQRWFFLALGLIASCGGGSRPAESADEWQDYDDSSFEASSAAKALTVGLLNTGYDEVSSHCLDQLAAELSKAGFAVVTSSTEASDLNLVLNVRSTERQSMLTVYSNGVRQVTYDVEATLQVRSGSTVVDTFSTRFEADNGAVPDGAVRPLVVELAGSRKVEALAQSRRDAAEHSAQVATQDADRAKKLEEADLWLAADVRECRNAIAVEACDGVTRYLSVYSDGQFADEGRQALEDAKPKLEALHEDESYWSKTGWQRCQTEKSTDACSGVELYEMKYPAGLHSAKAHALLERVGVE